jgi:hypothetical protein
VSGKYAGERFSGREVSRTYDVNGRDRYTNVQKAPSCDGIIFETRAHPTAHPLILDRLQPNENPPHRLTLRSVRCEDVQKGLPNNHHRRNLQHHVLARPRNQPTAPQKLNHQPLQVAPRLQSRRTPQTAHRVRESECILPAGGWHGRRPRRFRRHDARDEGDDAGGGEELVGEQGEAGRRELWERCKSGKSGERSC